METRSKRIKLMDSYEKSYDEVKQFLLDNCSSINNLYSSEEHPFFYSKGETSIEDQLKENTKLNNTYLDFMDKNNFNLKLKFLYLIINNENSEIQFKDFCFTKLKDMVDSSENYKYFIDIGFKYYGMGHVMVLSLIKETGELIFRTDGGSNGYERLYNYEFYKDLNPTKTHSNKIVSYKTAMSIITSGRLNTIFEDIEWFHKIFIQNN